MNDPQRAPDARSSPRAPQQRQDGDETQRQPDAQTPAPRQVQQSGERVQPVRGGIDASLGSRAGSPIGSEADRTGLGDGAPTGSSQGLTGAQGSGGGAERGPPGSIGGGPSLDG